jgi:hypothetical protein
MKVIGAGLPRTATLTQHAAMGILGLEPCHHMVAVFANLPTWKDWRAALEGDVRASELLKDYEAMVDWPGSYFYKDLMEDFPDAKVLLSVRSGESWAASMRKTIWECLYGEGLVGHMTAAREQVDPDWHGWMDTLRGMWTERGLMNGKETTDEFMAQAYERYNEEVKATVPADRLLVWSPKDGWEPLCDFLEVPVPDVPLPHINDTEGFGHLIVGGALAVIQKWQDAAAPAPAHA